MTTICSPNLVPTYNELHALLSPFYTAEGTVILPIQQTLLSPVWGTINSPKQQLEATISEMMQSQGSGMYDELLTVLTDFIGISIESILPDIPGFPGFNFINILDGDLQDMIDLVKLPGFDFSLVTLLPNPIYPTLNVPDWQNLITTQTAINEYYQILPNTIFDLISIVTDILEVAGMPALPTFPTLAEIIALLPSSPTLDDLFSFSIPGFVFQLAMPIPLIPTVNIPDYDLSQGLRNLYVGLATETVQLIIDFVGTLPLTFNFPIFCLEITVIPE